MKNANFIKLLFKNTKILINEKNDNRQLTFLLKSIPLNDTKKNVQEYYEKLLTSYILCFFSGEKLNYWKCQFSDKNLFKSVTVALSTSFKTEKNKYESELYYAKISLSDRSSNIKDSWKIFVKDVLENIEDRYNFNNIEYITSLKIAIVFEFDNIENQGFTSGKLIDTKLDKNNKLICFPKQKQNDAPCQEKIPKF